MTEPNYKEKLKDVSVEIEDDNGNTICAFRVDEEGEIVELKGCSIADVEGDYIFETEKNLIRIQEDNHFK